jgi:hypothetical protein
MKIIIKIKRNFLSNNKSAFSPYPFYILQNISRIPGFLIMISKNINKWKDIFYCNNTLEIFYEINFFNEYQKIQHIDLLIKSVKINYLQYKDINNKLFINSEKENDIELNNITVISKESFSFNKPNYIPIILTYNNNNNKNSEKYFYPTHIYLKQPKEEEKTNIKSALFLSGKGKENIPNKAEIDNIIFKIRSYNYENYSKIDYDNLTYLGYLEFYKIKKGDYKEKKVEKINIGKSSSSCDFIIVILIKNFDDEIILTTGPFGIFGVYEENKKDLDYVSSFDYKYLKEKFLLEEI